MANCVMLRTFIYALNVNLDGPLYDECCVCRGVNIIITQLACREFIEIESASSRFVSGDLNVELSGVIGGP